MSIAELDKVDGIGVDKKEKALHLLISDHMDWKEEDIHIEILQDKINAYLQFIEGRQYVKRYGRGFKTFYIDISQKYAMTEKCREFILVASRQLTPHGIYIRVSAS